MKPVRILLEIQLPCSPGIEYFGAMAFGLQRAPECLNGQIRGCSRCREKLHITIKPDMETWVIRKNSDGDICNPNADPVCGLVGIHRISNVKRRSCGLFTVHTKRFYDPIMLHLKPPLLHFD